MMYENILNILLTYGRPSCKGFIKRTPPAPQMVLGKNLCPSTNPPPNQAVNLALSLSVGILIMLTYTQTIALLLIFYSIYKCVKCLPTRFVVLPVVLIVHRWSDLPLMLKGFHIKANVTTAHRCWCSNIVWCSANHIKSGHGGYRKLKYVDRTKIGS